MNIQIIILLAITSALGIVLGYFVRYALAIGKKGSLEIEIKKMVLEAKEKAQKIIKNAEKKAEELAQEIKEKEKEKDEQFQKTENRLIKKEELLDKRQLDLDKEVDSIKQKIEDIKTTKEQVEERSKDIETELERISQLSVEDAREELLNVIKKDHEEDLSVRLSKLEKEGEDRFENQARENLAAAIQRMGNSTVSEFTTSSVTITSDDIKGKVIGKEGRNIRAFERVAGVELIVDDTPGVVIISSFDSVRRQIAKVALENLLMDGRIQPVKIEEFVAKAKETINKIIKEKGEKRPMNVVCIIWIRGLFQF